MHQALLASRIEIAIIAAIAGIVYIRRANGRDRVPAVARYVLGSCAFLLAALVVLGVLSSVIAYSILCFCLATVFIVDMFHDEGVRRRRMAMLSPRPIADMIPMLWIAIALLSTLPLIPYVVAGINTATTLIAGGCAIALAAVAWRIASAPIQLTGEDPKKNPQVELLYERADRARRAGLACVVAVGSIAFFLSFVDATPLDVGGLGRVTDLEMLLVCFGIWIWQILYVRQVFNSARTLAP